MKIIIFDLTNNNEEDAKIGLLRPSEEALSFATIEEIAEKDVPHNLPYWIIDDSQLPQDRSTRNEWDIDPAWGDPHGFGGESDEFSDEVLLKYYNLLREQQG